MKCMEHIDNRVDQFWLPLELGRGGRVKQFSLLPWSAKVPTPIEYHRSVFYNERGT